VGTLGGLSLIFAIIVIAGVIAYLGDRVGHQIGRRRMTLFNLRPKYTSTIIAVGTGMMIALAVTVVALAFSAYARAAFFNLDEINNRVNQLQATADTLNKRARETNVVINRGDLLYEQYLRITPELSREEKLKELSAFFDTVVQALDRRYARAGLKPRRLHSTDPEVARKLSATLADQRVTGFLLRGPIIIIAIADENLFVNDPIHFGFNTYADALLFRAGQVLASVEVDGGTAVAPTIAYGQLQGAVGDEAIGIGMPGPFSRALPELTPDHDRQMREQIRTGRGRFYIVAKAALDVYPHTGAIPIAFDVQRKPK
jgi:tetrahydromethanopterin S-methyltransferase subunit B